MVSYSGSPQSGNLMCYPNRTYHLLQSIADAKIVD